MTEIDIERERDKSSPLVLIDPEIAESIVMDSLRAEDLRREKV